VRSCCPPARHRCERRPSVHRGRRRRHDARRLHALERTAR
jgi:hypothetical protein